jgi:ribosomal protein L14E/L6E/L27E
VEESHISIGQVVRSTKGRDKDNFFIVINKIDEEYVLIVDGNIRRLDKPKKKKLKHLMKLNILSEECKERIINNKKMNNAFIRRELEKLGVKS